MDSAGRVHPLTPQSFTPQSSVQRPSTPSTAHLPTTPSSRGSVSNTVQSQAPEGSILRDLAEIGNVLSVIFVGKESSELGKHFSLYRPQEGTLKTACEMLKATGRAGALVLGSVLVGASRAIAFGGSALIGGLLTMATMASFFGLLWMIFSKDAFGTLKNAGKFLGSAAAAVPAVVGAYCQHFAFQKPNTDSPITTKELWNATWEQHASAREDNVSLAGTGAAIGVGVGFVLALVLDTAFKFAGAK